MLKLFSGRTTWFVIVSIGLMLGGCEAPLVLDGVEKMRAQPIHRTDRYQAAASHGDNVVVVGNQGVIVWSADGGTSWQRVELDGWPALIDVTSCPGGEFVALTYDRTIVVSGDGGKSWQTRTINDTPETPQSITCAPDGRVWVVGSFTYIWSTADLGESWTESTRDEDSILTTVQFFDAQNGVVTGEFGTMLRTTDGGTNWEQMPPLPDEFYPQEAYFTDPDRGWVIGLGGSILYTADGGQSWTEQASGTQVSLFGIEAVGGQVYVVGGEGTMLTFRNGGWESVDHGKPIRLYIRAIRALDDKRVLLGGVGGALHIVDTTGV